jgi:hypothetical protein
MMEINKMKKIKFIGYLKSTGKKIKYMKVEKWE